MTDVRRAQLVAVLALLVTAGLASGCANPSAPAGLSAPEVASTSAAPATATQGTIPTDAATELVTPGTAAFPFTGPDGRSWTVLVHQPDGQPTTARTPLVLVFAGLERPAALEERESGFDGAADHAGVLVAYLNTPSGSWDAGSCCGNDAADHTDDTAGVLALLPALARAYPFNHSRLGLSGFSNGAMFALSLACDRRFDPVVVGSASGSLQRPGCHPRPTTVLTSHYDNDSTVPVGGGRVPVLNTTIVAETATLAPFAAADGCTLPTLTASGSWTVRGYDHCSSGHTVTSYRNPLTRGNPHYWPRQPLSDSSTFAETVMADL